MRLNKYLAVLTGLLLISACSQDSQEMAATEDSAAATESRPNILFIVADDLGFTDIGAFGSEIATPNLDRLAYQGLRLNNLHAASACQQTRTMLMASAPVSGTIINRPSHEGGQRNNLLSREWAIIPELMQEAGYATYMTGKWDLGWDDGYTPATRGFDRSFVQLNGAASFFREEFLMPESIGLGYEDGGERLEFDALPEDFYATEHYTNKMLEYLQENEEGTPWFAYMPYTAPHWPLQLPEELLHRNDGRYDMGYDELRVQRFERAGQMGVLPENSSLDEFSPLTEPWENLTEEEKQRYSLAEGIFAGMIEHLDMSIGRVISYLEESGQMENTVIVFTADHGASSGEHGVATGRVPQGGGPQMPDGIDNSIENFGQMNSFVDHGRGFGEAASAPFKYQKGTIDEGGLRAAAFVRYPAAVEAGDVGDAFMSMMDFLPTFLEIAGTEHPGASTFQGREINDIRGRSAWQYLTGQADTVHLDTDVAGWDSGDGGALIRGGYKIINTVAPGQPRDTTDWRLYNLVADPGEHNDLSADHPEMVLEMVAEWEANWK